MADQHVQAKARGPHVSFASMDGREPSRQDVIAQPAETPSTPTRPSSDDLPTPPDSHIDLSQSTLPPPPQVHQHTTDDASTPAGGSIEVVKPSTVVRDQSPSAQVEHRRAKRTSAGSTIAANESAPPSSSDLPVTERQWVLAEAHHGRGRARSRGHTVEESAESSRSRTPSPILGSLAESTGHLSFTGSLMPSAEEVRNLLYGDDDDQIGARQEQRPNQRTEVDRLMQHLGSMGLANIEGKGDTSMESKEEELALMVKKLIDHAQQQETYLGSLEQTLHDTRIRSISLLTSLRTSFAHTLAAEYGLRARVEAELEGARAQAKKLSIMLARSESRNEEIEQERAMSAEEEVLWQEEMKDHASAYAQQQAARARAAQMAHAQAHGQKTTGGEAIKGESTNIDPDGMVAPPEISASSPLDASSPAHVATELDEPFEERKEEGGTVTGLGISAGAAEANINSSPLSTIVKERNKLLSDKRYLKSRVKDTEAQRDRLEAELKSLRPLLVRGAPSKSNAATPVLGHQPSTPGRSHKRDRSRRRRQATMGDAEAEHLLLAARRLKEINRSKFLDEDGRPKTPPVEATPSSSINRPRTPKTPRTAVSGTPKSGSARDAIESSQQSASSSRIMPNGSPLASKNSGPATLGRWGRHERVDSAMSNSGIDDLLQAAQTVLTPEKKTAHKQSHSRSRGGEEEELHSEEEEGAEDETLTSSQSKNLLPSVAFSSKDIGPLNGSPKRRRVSSAAVDLERSRGGGLTYSPGKFPGRRIRTSTEGAEPLLSQSSAGLSALDLLADQAAASQHPSQSSDPSHSGEGEGEGIPEVDEVYGSDDEDDMIVDEQEGQGKRPSAEGGIGSHYYPRGAYGHAYAQHPIVSSDIYRSTHQSGYTYGPSGVPITSSSPALPVQAWTSATSFAAAPRNGIQPTRGLSPPSANGGARFAEAYQHSHRSDTTSMSHHQRRDSLPDDSSASNRAGSQKGGNTSPDKRLPYVRWSDEEDQKLRKAIAEYGQRWESVARVVGTRSYHQCRQRYLLMRRKEAAAREGGGEDTRPNTQVAAGAH